MFYYIEKHALCQRDYRLQSFLSVQFVHGDLCKHLGIDSSTDQIPIIRIGSRIFLNRHVHADYFKMIEFYKTIGIRHVFLYSIDTNIYHIRSMPALRVNTSRSTYTFTSVKEIIRGWSNVLSLFCKEFNKYNNDQ